MNLSMIDTEKRNKSTLDIDRCSTLELVSKINTEDRTVAEVVGEHLSEIATVIDEVSARLLGGGRLIYMGAGTSGRLGVLDAAECPPTYGVPSSLVIGLIAGGLDAMFEAQEGAEDSITLGVEDLKKLKITESDSVIGLAASGRTPYVIAALDYANSVGAYTASISCVNNSEMSSHVKQAIEVVTGPEAITGSTRMKAGTAEKLVLNMISTGCMIRYGKVYENLMVDVQPTNLKLVERAKRIVSDATRLDLEESTRLYEESGSDVKVAIIMGLGNCNANRAREVLAENNGNVHAAIMSVRGK